MKILHTADIHLREGSDERMSALKSVLDLGTKEKVDFLAISGDLFDADADAYKLKAGLRGIFSGAGYDIVIIPGNHDERSFEDRAYFGPNVRVLRSYDDVYEKGDVAVAGLPFSNMSEQEIYPVLQNMSDRLGTDKCNILLYHGELLDSYYSRHDFGEEGESRYMPVRLDFFSGLSFSYVLAGHFHANFNAWEFKKENGTGYYIYSGSPVSVTKRETGRRKVNLFTAGGAPREESLKTFYYDDAQVKLDPFSGVDPVSAIKNRIDAAGPGAGIILTVNGYINSSRHGIDETKLIEEIGLLKSGKNIVEVNFRAVDLKRILDDELFSAFEKKLKAKDYPAAMKENVTEIFLKAMMESI